MRVLLYFLKELVQNADDAEAGSIAFLLDSTQHPNTNLCIPEFSRYQGPALYSWNDAIFGPKDWEGIQKIGRSIKEKTTLKVGRFGLGFVSVYHLAGLLHIFSTVYTKIKLINSIYVCCYLQNK